MTTLTDHVQGIYVLNTRLENQVLDITKEDQFNELLLISTKGQQLKYGKALEYFVSIDLSDNSLSGEIPRDIASLDALINLNLSANHLSGKIPNKIGAMKSLESLDLSENKLSGKIPSSLSNLTSLSYMNFSYNELSGMIPSGRQLDTLNADNPSVLHLCTSATLDFVALLFKINAQEMEVSSMVMVQATGMNLSHFLFILVLS